MKVTLTATAGGHDAGATIDVTPGVAAHLIERGAATEAEAPKRQVKGGPKVGVDSPPPTSPNTAG